VALGTVLSVTVAVMYGDGCIMYIWRVAVVLSDTWKIQTCHTGMALHIRLSE